MATIKRKTPEKHISSKKGLKTLHKIIAAVIVIAFLAFLVFPYIFTGNDLKEEEYMFKKEGELSITDSSGHSKIKLDIEIADNDFDQQLGLMFRKEMDEDKGMLFVFPDEEVRSFWMINTYIPLDIIFADSSGKIVTIQKNAVPLSDNHYPSTKPAKYVLEVNAGFAEKYKILEGDNINYRGSAQ